MNGCSRAPLTAHSELFFPGRVPPSCNPEVAYIFPEFLNSHLDATIMNSYIGENVSCSDGEPFPIEVTWIGERPIKLSASAFVPTPEAEAHQKYQSRSGQLLGVESLPIGFFPFDESAVERACLTHLASILDEPSYPELLRGYRSPLSREVLQAICNLYHLNVRFFPPFLVNYSNSIYQKHPLLHDVLLFHLMSYITSRPILFTESSAATIINKLGNDYSGSKYFSSRLLNMQIKRVIHLASFTILNRVLSHLEKVLRSRTTSLWSVSVCTTLILCLCVEQIQNQAHAHITTLKASSNLPGHLIQEPQQSCGSLEDMLFLHLSKIFHSVYRTRQSGTNPLMYVPKAKIPNPREEGPENEIIGSLRSMMFHGKIQELAFVTMLKDTDNGSSKLNHIQNFPLETEEFSKLNSGRLVAKFLSMFNESSST